MVDANKDIGEDDPTTLGAAIWLAVLDGECSVEEAVTARRGQETPEETAVMRAICGPADAPASAPIGLHPALPGRGTGRERVIWGMVAVLAAAACLLWLVRLPEPGGEIVASCAEVASQIDREQRAVASLTFEVGNGQTGHLGVTTPQETIAFVYGETLVLRGTTKAAAPPSPSDVEVRLGEQVLACKEDGRALPSFTWHCPLRVPASTPATNLSLRVCAEHGRHVVACKDVARIDLREGAP